MTTITEDFVSFETVKLLKEKNCPDFGYSCIYDSEGNKAQTQSIIMKWLREVHHLEILVTSGFPFIDGKQQHKYFWNVVKVCSNYLEFPMNDPNSSVYSEGMTDSYEQAIEEAIKYCLEHLI